jgi:transcriptional regulator with XRE-family HTH domain
MVSNAVDVAVGGRIRTIRLACEMSGEQLAEACDVSQAALLNIEDGHLRAGAELLVLLSRELGCSVPTFFVDELMAAHCTKERRKLFRVVT